MQNMLPACLTLVSGQDHRGKICSCSTAGDTSEHIRTLFLQTQTNKGMSDANGLLLLSFRQGENIAEVSLALFSRLLLDIRVIFFTK